MDFGRKYYDSSTMANQFCLVDWTGSPLILHKLFSPKWPSEKVFINRLNWKTFEQSWLVVLLVRKVLNKKLETANLNTIQFKQKPINNRLNNIFFSHYLHGVSWWELYESWDILWLLQSRKSPSSDRRNLEENQLPGKINFDN